MKHRLVRDVTASHPVTSQTSGDAVVFFVSALVVDAVQAVCFSSAVHAVLLACSKHVIDVQIADAPLLFITPDVGSKLFCSSAAGFQPLRCLRDAKPLGCCTLPTPVATGLHCIRSALPPMPLGALPSRGSHAIASPFEQTPVFLFGKRTRKLFRMPQTFTLAGAWVIAGTGSIRRTNQLSPAQKVDHPDGHSGTGVLIKIQHLISAPFQGQLNSPRLRGVPLSSASCAVIHPASVSTR